MPTNECFSAAPPAQEADQGSVSPRLRGGEEEEENPGEEGRLRSHKLANQNIKDHFNCFCKLMPCIIQTPKMWGLTVLQTVIIGNEPAVNGVACLAVQKSKQSGYENEEEISVRNNNNSGRLHHKRSTLSAVCLPGVVLKIAKAH